MAESAVVTDSETCRRIVAAGALYDLFAVAPLATPWSAPFQLEILNGINKLAGFGGSMPFFLPIDLLFINLFGMVVLVWAISRLMWRSRGLAAGDLAVRLSVSAILGWYALQGSVNGIVWLFLVIELGFGAADWVALRSTAARTQALASR